MNREKLYTLAGEALFISQALEVSITSLVRLLNRLNGTKLNEEPILYLNDKKLLGPLIKELKTHLPNDQSWEILLGSALEARNWVAHRCFVRNIYAFQDNEVFEKLSERLIEATKKIAMADAVTGGFVVHLSKLIGGNGSGFLVEQD